MLYGKVNSLFLRLIQSMYLNALCEHNIEFLSVKPGLTYSNHSALRVKELTTVIQSYALQLRAVTLLKRFHVYMIF
jgi:hypothetical protein